VLSSDVLGGEVSRAEELDPEALKAAKELCAIVTKDSLRQMTAQLSSMTCLKSERTEDEADGHHRASRFAPARLRANSGQLPLELMDDAPPIYARHFTAAELREMIAFYQTPVGKEAISVCLRSCRRSSAHNPNAAQVQRTSGSLQQGFCKKRGLSIGRIVRDRRDGLWPRRPSLKAPRVPNRGRPSCWGDGTEPDHARAV